MIKLSLGKAALALTLEDELEGGEEAGTGLSTY